MDLKGKVAIVTGGSRGIGRAIVKEFVRRGADVAFTYMSNKQSADELVSELEGAGRKVACFQADAKDFDMAREVIKLTKEKFGAFDILVNNAGIRKDKSLLMMSREEWFEVIDTNLNSTFNYCKAGLFDLAKQKSGAIINITSVSGVIGLAGQTNYSAAKAGIIGLTKALAKELAKANVRVNAVAPGFIETDMIKDMPAKIKEDMLKLIPAGRMACADEVAKVVAFLASEKSNYITGQVIQVDGGLAIR